MINLLSSNFSATIDIIALILILFFAMYGAIKGFTKTFFSLFGTFIGLLFAVILSPSVVKFMQNEFNVVKDLSNEISGVVSKFFSKDVLSMKISDATKGSLTSAGLSGYVASIILSYKKGSYPPQTSVGDVLNPTFAYYIVLIISMVVLFIIFKLIFAVVCAIMKNAHKNKKIARFDKTLGFFLGIINGIINLELIIMLISIIPLNFFQNIYINIQLSTFTKIIQDINLFELIITEISQTNLLNTINGII